MPKLSAQIISILLHPIFMPLFAMYIIFHSDSYLNYNTNGDAKPMLYLFVFLLTVVMPGVSTLILVRNKMVSSFSMPLRRDRNAPYLITVFYYFLLYYLLRKIDNLPPVMLSMVLGAMVTLILILFINSRFKISAHAAGISGLVGIYIGLASTSILLPNMILLYGLIMLAGFVASARLRLDAHSSLEVYAGAVIGFLAEFVIIYWHLYL